MKKYIIIALVAILVIGVGVAVYLFIFNDKKSDNDLVLNNTNNTEETNTNSVSHNENLESLDFNLSDPGDLYFVSICYLNENPDDVIYFNEGLREEFARIPDKTSNEEIDLIASICESYDQKDSDYFRKLIETDNDKDGINSYLEIIFTTDDNNPDTDSDGYDDLKEVINGFNPNDLLEDKQNAIDEKLGILLKENPIDQDAVILACEELDYRVGSLISEKDSCLEQASRKMTDLKFCDKAKFKESSWYDKCIISIKLNSAITTADCLNIDDDWSKSYCLKERAIESKSLEPCSLLTGEFDEFIVCANGTYPYLENKTDCDTYRERMDDDDYSSCLWNVAYNTKDYRICEFKPSGEILACVNELAYKLKDPEICEYYNFFPDDFEKKKCLAQIPN
ncbi:MAG: hypothetical protein WCW66_03880 [Patescibacteria group bacterium]